MNQDSKPDTGGLIVASQWLSELFGTPATPQYIAQTTTPQAQQTLHWMGEQLDAATKIQALNTILAQDYPEPLAVHLQRRYTSLFEGIFKHRAVLPYESAWQASDAAITEMKATLRALDLHVNPNCCEPPDHLAIELAALTLALRDENYPIAAELILRLQSWVPRFSAALHQQDKDGFYAAAGDVLLAFLKKARNTLTAHLPTRYVGEFA